MPSVQRPRGYAKPLVVADDLGLLHGPSTGLVILPPHLDWTGAAAYDLDVPSRVIDYCRTVLIEATKPDDLHTFLDEETLRSLWPTLWLSPALRHAWEDKFPALRSTRSRDTAA